MPSPLRDGHDWRAALVPRSVLRIVRKTSAGILTCRPSATPFGLALGPDSPWADLPSPGNLRLSANGILTRFIVTHSGMITRTSSRGRYPSPFDLTCDALLPRYPPKGVTPAASVPCLVPFIIGAGLLDQ